MGRKRKKSKQRMRGQSSRTQRTAPGTFTTDRKRKSGHYQGTYYSDVYRDGKAYVYTAWNDNEDVEGTPMNYDEWASHYTTTSASGKTKKKRRRR